VVIGLFGLVGAAGILAANMAGRLADTNRSTGATLVAGVLLTGAFGLLWLGRSSLAALIVGIVVLDIGTQGMQITNQAIIYALRPDARSRINSAYMVCYFIGGAVGSVTAGVVYGSHGWSGVCLLGAGFGLLTCALTAITYRSGRSGTADDVERSESVGSSGSPIGLGNGNTPDA
jgi:predicted MFS family arabinose efflux permease